MIGHVDRQCCKLVLYLLLAPFLWTTVAAGSVNGRAEYSGKVIISDSVSVGDLVIPPDTMVEFGPNGEYNITKGSRVLVQGDISAPTKRIFSGAGSVSFAGGKVSSVYPEWWGASGNGFTDDTQAIQSAIDSIDVGTVMLHGRYRIHGLRLKSGVSLIGRGIKAKTGSAEFEAGTSLIYEGTGVALLIEGTATGYLERVAIQDLAVIDKNGTGKSGIRTSFLRHSTLSNVYVQGFDIGIDYNKFSWLNKVSRVQILRSRWFGLKVEDQGEDSLFELCIIRYCGKAGCNLSYSSKTNLFVECDFSNNPVGVDVYSTGNLPIHFTIQNCHFEDCDIAGIRIRSGNTHLNSYPSFSAIGARFRQSEVHKKKFHDAVAVEVDQANLITFINCYNSPGYSNFLRHTGSNASLGRVLLINVLHEGDGPVVRTDDDVDKKEKVKVL